MSTSVDVFIDYVCPFCFLVEPALEELRRDRDVKVNIRPFELRPDPVPTLRPEDDYLPRVWNDLVYPMAERIGIPIRLPSVSPQPRTEKAFLVLQLAHEHNIAGTYSQAHRRRGSYCRRIQDPGTGGDLRQRSHGEPRTQTSASSRPRLCHRNYEDHSRSRNRHRRNSAPGHPQCYTPEKGRGRTDDFKGMQTMTRFLEQLMAQAVIRSITHVESGGLPFVGVIVDGQQAISEFGVNRVQETGDPSAHAEIVAIRDALSSSGKTDLRGTTLLATGEPCGMCYRHAINARITDIRVAVDRDQVAELGFDYRHSYPSFGITDSLRNTLMRLLRVSGDTEPFIRFLALQNLRN